jgi:hypothetical protein
MIELDMSEGEDLAEQLKPVFGKMRVYVPHVAFSSSYRGLGYPSFLYTLLINRGISLATTGQTLDANKMWRRIADRTGASLYYFNTKVGKFTGPNDKKSVQVLTKQRPL